MKSSLRTKLFALSITALFVAQPATANYSAALYDTGKKLTTAVVLGYCGHKLQTLINQKILKPYVYKRNGNVAHDELMKDAQKDTDGTFPRFITATAQSNDYLNSFSGQCFTNGYYIGKSGKDLHTNYITPEFSKEYGKKAFVASVWAASGFLRTYISKLLVKDGKYAAFFDFFARTPMAALTQRFLEETGFGETIELASGRAFADLTTTGINLSKAAGFGDAPTAFHDKVTSFTGILGY